MTSPIFELESMIVSPSENDASRTSVSKMEYGEKKEENSPIARSKGISATSGLINFICGMIGPGCFSLAISFKEAGIWGGLILVFAIGILSTISMSKIVACSQYLANINGDQHLDYGDMAETACLNSYPWARRHAKLAKLIVNTSLLAFQIGVISVALVFATEHVVEVYEYAFGERPALSKTVLIMLYFIPQLLLNFIGHIKLITVLSLCGNVIIFAAMFLIAKELLVRDWYPTWDLNGFTSLEGFSIAAGAFIYSFEGQAMVLPLENSLKRAGDMRGFTGVLTTSMNLVMSLYAFLGFFGYIAFGNHVQGSLTLNLPNSLLSVSIKALLVAKMFFGSALQLFVIVHSIIPTVLPIIPKENRLLLRLAPYVLRATLMFFSLAMAVLVPNLMQIIPLVGITSGMLISLILPALLDAAVFLPVYTKSGQQHRFVTTLIGNAFLFFLGWAFLISGLYSSIHAIVQNRTF